MKDKNEIIEYENEIVDVEAYKNQFSNHFAYYAAEFFFNVFTSIAEDFTPVVKEKAKRILIDLLNNNNKE